jgi:hypothetical protein
MFQTLHTAYRKTLSIFLSATVMLIMADKLQAQCGTYDPIKATRVPSSSFTFPAGFYTGLMVWFPADYNTNPTKDFPVIIYFPGKEAQGTGSLSDLCKIITDGENALPGRLERNQVTSSVTVGGETFTYLVIAPQYNGYGDPNGTDFTYPDQTDALIDYIVDHYRIDESRIYLTGMSTGANMVMDYLSSSVTRANRIAAASFSSLCFPTNLSSAGSVQGPANVANGDVATWFVNCNTESDQYCGINTPTGWVNAMNNNSPTIPPRTSFFNPNVSGFGYPQSLNYCQGFAHDTWSALYSPDWTPTGGGPNFYDWTFSFQQESALPIVLKSFTARLSNGKVYLRWVTSSEQDNAGFTIERAGADGSYKAITTVPGGGTTSGDRTYDYVDESPLANLSFYRIKQIDAGGKNRYYDTRKVMNKSRFKNMIIVTPNPFTADPSAFINVDKKQRVSVWLTDMSGRVLSKVNGTFEEGTTELSLPTGSLPRGIYFIKLAGENITETHKIIKQ